MQNDETFCSRFDGDCSKPLISGFSLPKKGTSFVDAIQMLETLLPGKPPVQLHSMSVHFVNGNVKPSLEQVCDNVSATDEQVCDTILKIFRLKVMHSQK